MSNQRSPLGPKILIVLLLGLPIWLFTVVPLGMAMLALSLEALTPLTLIVYGFMIGLPLVLFIGTIFAFRSDRRMSANDRNI